MGTGEDTVLYRQGSNRVTRTQVQFEGRTYNLADIASVSMVASVLRREYGYLLAAIGAVLLVAGYLVWGVFLTPMLAGVVLIVVGLVMAFVVRQHYTIRLNHNDGQVTALQFTDRSQAEHFLQAITRARS